MEMWTNHPIFDQLYEEAVKSHPQTFDKDWQTQLKEQFQKALGTFTSNELFDAKIIEKTRERGYQRQSIEITTLPRLRMHFYLLIPDPLPRQPLPVVLALHGHGYGNNDAAGLNPDGRKRRGKPGYHKDFAVSLVKREFVVAVPELIGFGRRRYAPGYKPKKDSDNTCYSFASQLLLFGKTLAGLRIFETRRLIDYIEKLEIVQRDAIGCMGISGGGLVAAFTSALDDRIRATVVSGYTNTFRTSIMARRHCLDNYIPGILQFAEMPELIALNASRPLFIEAGTKDHLFPIEYTEKAVGKIKEIYSAFGAEKEVDFHFFEGGHEINGEKSFDWLCKKLF